MNSDLERKLVSGLLQNRVHTQCPMVVLNSVLAVLRNWHYEVGMPEQFLITCILLDVVDQVYAEDIRINLAHFIRLALNLGFPKCIRWLLSHPTFKSESFDLLLEPGKRLLILEIMNSGNLEFMRAVLECARIHFGHDLSKFSYCSLVAASKGLVDLWNLLHKMGISPVETADRSLECRSEPTTPRQSNFTCLAAAIIGQKWALVRTMLNQISNRRPLPTLDDRTWLLVLNSGQTEIFERMVQLGLEPSVQLMKHDGDVGVTWLMLAASGWGDRASITYLTLRNPDQILWQNINRRNVAHYITSSPPILPSGFAVLAGRVDFGITDHSGQCPLSSLIRSFNVPTPTLKRIIDSSSRSFSSLVESLRASDQRRLELVNSFVLCAKYDIYRDCDDSGRSFWWHVCRLGRNDVLALMLERLEGSREPRPNFDELMKVAATEPVLRLLRQAAGH